ncbi:MAG TPA: hypothetical protein VFT22_30725 [Kofleriaceae bacterium]|nr:hypothetical protein [Kofleriaceae bacterium]
MNRFVLIGALATGACGSATDDRPATLEYITQTILAPSCAPAQCHSAFKRQVGDQFDTVDAARLSIVANGLVVFPDDTTAPDSSFLITVLTVGTPSILDPGSNTKVRMPYDAPMPDADVELIRAWIADGAHGAQCVPNAQGLGCQNTTIGAEPVSRVVMCSKDGEAGDVVETCAMGKFCTYYSGNGVCR